MSTDRSPPAQQGDRTKHCTSKASHCETLTPGGIIMTKKPAVSLAAVPGRRQMTLEAAQRLERAGFSGIYCPSFGDGLALCEALALATSEIPFGTTIANIYTRHPYDYAQTAAFIHEMSRGRFRFGIGVSHGPMLDRLHLHPGKPLADIRRFMEDLRASAEHAGELPPIVLASLRRNMVKLAAEIAQGAVWANAARSHMADSLSHLPEGKRRDPAFFIGNMIPTCIDNDRAAAAAVNRRTLTGYVRLPNYQNYWIEAGFADEMLAIRKAIAEKDDARIPQLMSDRWLSQVTLYGPAAEVREAIEAWYESGVNTLIVVPSSTRGGQMVALQELLDAVR
jgi:alkanesulfonate monooxygenase SsuD/methylene tetrahydromethanopterin reductase-like flavin-dependent oxidoreductase (luciferase family)